MKRKYLKCLIVIVVVSLIGLFIYQNVNRENKPLPEVKLKEIVNKDKTMAIMVSSDGSNYQEYNSDTWPRDNYKFKEAKCIDNNGDEIKEAVTYEDGKITLTTNKTVYCTVYFDYKGTINILRENDSNKNLSLDIQGDMYRYQGTDEVHNWICFGTTDNCGTNDDNIDKYMYRIIGITEDEQLYLLKETFLKERETNTFAWNDKYYVDSSHSAYCDDGKCPEWNTSLLFKRMNGTSNGTQTGSGSTLNKEWTDIFVDSSEYDYLKSGDSNSGGAASEWYNLIVDHEWMYGDTINTTSSVIYNGKNMYDIETGQTSTTHYIGTAGNITEETNYKWNEKTDPVRAKIGLMYMHDVAYAYYDGNDPNTRGNPGNGTSVLNSWIHFRKDGYNTSSYYEWLSTRRGVFNTEVPYVWARYVYYDGTLNGSHELYYSFGVRPVFYLNSSAKIASGKGTKESPLILEI